MLNLIFEIIMIVLFAIVIIYIIYIMHFAPRDLFEDIEEEGEPETKQRVLVFYDDPHGLGKAAEDQANEWLRDHPKAKITQHSSSFIGEEDFSQFELTLLVEMPITKEESEGE